MIDNGAKYRITKVSGKHMPMMPHGPIGNGYSIEGYMFYLPEIGAPLVVVRTKRNNLNMLGKFQTSPLTDLRAEGDGWVCTTQSGSIYRIERCS